MNVKNRQKAEYGESTIPNSELEEDRLVPLELRGAAKGPSNLWPEPRTSAGTITPSGGCRQGQEGDLLEKHGSATVSSPWLRPAKRCSPTGPTRTGDDGGCRSSGRLLSRGPVRVRLKQTLEGVVPRV